MGKHTSSKPSPAVVKTYAKAVVGFITPVIVSLAATADGGWTTGELLTALGAGLVTAAGVGAVPNRTSDAVAPTVPAAFDADTEMATTTTTTTAPLVTSSFDPFGTSTTTTTVATPLLNVPTGY